MMHKQKESEECCDLTDCMAVVSSCCGSQVHRRFLTAQEKLEQLETYKDQLAKELAGVEERIKELKKG
jgi:hypothetical protein